MGEQEGRESYGWGELLVLTLILGVVALIVVPQFSEGIADPRQGELEEHLQSLRSQFELYRVEHNDVYPWDDGTGMLAESDEIVRRLTSRTNAQGDRGGDLGPYLQSVPANPYSDGPTVRFGSRTGGDVDWVIDTQTGVVTSGRPGR